MRPAEDARDPKDPRSASAWASGRGTSEGDRPMSRAARAAAGSMQDTGATDVAPASKVLVYPIGETSLNAGLTVTTSEVTTRSGGCSNGSVRHGGCIDGGVGRSKVIEGALVLQGSVVADVGDGLARCIRSIDIDETALHVAECVLRVAATTAFIFQTGNMTIGRLTGISRGDRRTG